MTNYATDMEERVSNVHENYFFKEFTFAVNKVPAVGGDVEFADNFVYLDGIAFVYQMKERAKSKNHTSQVSEDKWFRKKVIGNGCKQIRDTLKFLKERPTITLRNQRGHEIAFSKNDIKVIHKMILYSPREELSPHFFNKKYHESKDGGFIHLFPETVYQGIVSALLTPAEVSNYLSFREQIIKNCFNMTDTKIIEAALLGQFLCGEIDSEPLDHYKQYYAEHIQGQSQNIHEWDMSGVLHRAFERSDGTSDYHCWLKEVAKLDRFELKEFKDRWFKAMNQARQNVGCPPYFLISSRTKCGFVFLPIVQEDKSRADKNLIGAVTVEKYRHQVDKCIGFSFLAAENGYCDNLIVYDEFVWEPDQLLEKQVKEMEKEGLLRKVLYQRTPSYQSS